MWRNEWGDATPDRDEMWEWVMEHMDEDDLAIEFFNIVDPYRLLEWARKQDGFYEKFEDQIQEAEQNFFDEYAWEDDDDDDEN